MVKNKRLAQHARSQPMHCRSWSPICVCKKLIVSICNLVMLPPPDTWLCLLGTCWKSAGNPKPFGFGGIHTYNFPFSMYSTKMHCKKQCSPQHSLLERVSGTLHGNFQSSCHSNSDITFQPPPKVHWHACKYPINKQTAKQENKVGGK